MFYECASQLPDGSFLPSKLCTFIECDSDKICGCFRLEVAMALYWFCADYHGGQGCILYEILSRVSDVYTPGLMETSDRVKTNFESQIVYENLQRWVGVLVSDQRA